MKKFEFKRSWCEYLSPCPYMQTDLYENTMYLGSYECTMDCPYCVDSKQNNTEGWVLCKHDEIDYEYNKNIG